MCTCKLSSSAGTAVLLLPGYVPDSLERADGHYSKVEVCIWAVPVRLSIKGFVEDVPLNKKRCS